MGGGMNGGGAAAAGGSAGGGGGGVAAIAGAASGGAHMGGTSAAGSSGAHAGAGGSVGGSAGSAGGSGGSAGATGASGGGGGGGAGANAMCQTIKSEYAAELEKQLACNPNAGSQCTDRAAAAPGCECRVFIEPSDPFAIEHLSNVANGWFDEDCSMPTCPAKCTTANAGSCQADPKSPLGGRCVTP